MTSTPSSYFTLLRRQFSLSPYLPFTSPLLTGYRNVRYLKRRWYPTARRAGLYKPLPTISHLRIASKDGNSIEAHIDMAAGDSTVKDLISHVTILTSLLRVHRIRVEHLSHSIARITVTFLPPSPRRNLPHRAHRDPNPLRGLDLERRPILLDSDRGSIQLTKSILIGGESESGKSNLVWHLLSILNDLNIPYRLWVIDPAGGVELNDLEDSPLTRRYADRPKDVDSLIRAFHDSMDNRLRTMKARHQRRHFATPTEPVEICIIDELLLVKQALHADDVSSPMGEILAVGRKALHIVIGLSQLGQKDAIGQIRDLFPQRICLRTRSRESTDTVLGTGATEQGAACHKISQPGEGYVYTDHTEGYEKIVVPFVENTLRVAHPPNARTLPSSPPPPPFPLN